MAKATKIKEYAVIETGGKQHIVYPGLELKIAKLDGKMLGLRSSGKSEEVEAGKKVTFDNVLIVDDGKEAKVGTPYIKGAKVEGEFLEAGKDKKITVIKYKSKSRYFVKSGHRQDYMKVKITKI
jgi:large subunit ribosomal protein L21